MKTISTLFFAGMLMSALCVAFVACNEPKETEQKDPLEGVGMAPVPESEVPKEVTAFFEENLSQISQSLFYNDGEPQIINKCVMINSAEELPEADLYGTVFEYPPIDFYSHTLVIGQWKQMNGGIHLISKNLVAEQNGVTMNLVLGQKSGKEDYSQAIGTDFFCGFYPKITSKSINLNVTNKN